VLTPVADIPPLIRRGLPVRNVTMHNEGPVQAQGGLPGGTGVVRGAGDVIPEIVSVREPRGDGWSMPSRCPVCGGEVVREEPYIAHRCINPFCGAQRLERLRHFAAAMDIEGLGHATLTQLIDRRMVEDPSDLYRLSREQLVELDGFADKSAQNLVERIAASNRPELGRFVYALGIPQVGWATADLLASDFASIEEVRDATEEDLKRVDG